MTRGKDVKRHGLASGKEPFENVDTARVRYLTLAETSRLLNGCAVDFRRLVRGALETGARYGELMALKVADFNPDSGTIAIQQSKSPGMWC